MKIAINTRFLLPKQLEGIGFFTQEVSRRLVERWPEHQFLFCFDRPYDPRFIFGPQVKPLVISPPARHPFLWYLWFEWSLAKQLKKHQCDVFFSPDGYCSLNSQVPTVMVSHDVAFLHYPNQVPPLVRQYYTHFVPRYLAKAQRVVTVSDFVRRDILQHYPQIEPAKITVACNGVQPAFKPLSATEQASIRQRHTQGRPYFFYLGAVHPRKNVDRLIAAYDQYRSQGGSPALLLLGGRLAWQTAASQAAHEQAAYRSDIHFLGYVAEPELPGLLAAAKALVYPSLSEGFGVPLLEAMHCEVPIITSQTTSLPEVAGDAALLVDPENTQVIAAAMLQLDRSATLAATLIANGRQQRQLFSWEKATDTVQAAIEHAYSSSR